MGKNYEEKDEIIVVRIVSDRELSLRDQTFLLQKVWELTQTREDYR